MDQKRAEEILHGNTHIEVLYQGSPVWIKEVKNNNCAMVTYIDSHNTVEVPVYKLVEKSPVPLS